MKRIWSLVILLLLFSMVLTACKDKVAEIEDAEVLLEEAETKIDYSTIDDLVLEPGTRIAVVLKGSKSGYWTAVTAGIQKAVDDFNEVLEYEGDDKIIVTFDGPSSEKDVDSQINIIDAVLAENPTVLCLAAIDMESCEAQVEAAAENEIPVIFIDSAVENGSAQIICATDNYEAGREAARQMAALIGEEGDVAILAHILMTETSQSRLSGFQDEMKENYPLIHIVDSSYDEISEEVDLVRIVEDVLEEYPLLDGYWGTNDAMTSNILAGVKAAGNETVAIVGFDSGAVLQEAIKDGILAGTISQNPYGMGYAAIVAGARAILDKENDSFINTGYIWITADNIEDDDIQKYLYQ